jgi:AcrR family transcriptional regulator
MAPRLRDRDGTERSLREAALRLLAREGYAALGPNAIAAEAGCDKKLIYRYFGGVEGLLDALGEDLSLWLGGPPPAVPEGADYAGRLAALLAGYTAGLRADPALQRLLAAELVEASAPLQRLDAARGAALGAWAAELLGGRAPPPGVDAPAVNAVLLAALHYLTLIGGTLGRFAGVECASPEGRARIDAALQFLLARAHATPEAKP